VAQLWSLGGIMRYKYPAAVVGCLAHAIALTGYFFWYIRHTSSGSDDTIWYLIAFLAMWFLWYFGLGFSNMKARRRMILIPMAVGLIILSPMIFMLLEVLGMPVQP
jgi:hypothetical protein